jgi:hypothetical protein
MLGAISLLDWSETADCENAMPVETVPFPFIVGNPRSGTTLLRAMFDSHPEMAVPWESYFVTQLKNQVARYEGGNGFNSSAFIEDLYNTNFQHWKIEESFIKRLFATESPRSYADAVRLVFAGYASLHGKARYGDKTPIYVLQIQLFLHIIRDGRDVALSLLDVSWGPNRVDDCARNWKKSISTGRRAGQIIGNDRYCEVRYEDIVANPTEELHWLCNFIELDFDSQMLDYPSRATEIISPDPYSQYHKGIYCPPTAGLRRWHVEMNQQDCETFEEIAGDALKEFGYQL